MVQQSKELESAKLEMSLVQLWIKIHAAFMAVLVSRLMMWGTISYARKTQMVHIHGNLNAAQYRYEVLTLHMLPAMNISRDVFQHDNAQPHIARATVDFLAIQNVRVLPGHLNHRR